VHRGAAVTDRGQLVLAAERGAGLGGVLGAGIQGKTGRAQRGSPQPYGGAEPPVGIAAGREVQQSGVQGASGAGVWGKQRDKLIYLVLI